jgi:transposase
MVPGFSADSLVKFRQLWRASGTILFKRLQFFMPLLGRNRPPINMKSKTSKNKKQNRKISIDADWEPINLHAAGVDMRPELYKRLGVDLTAIEGIGVLTGLIFLTEVGPDVSRFQSEKHFCSWLGLCPDNRISGGQALSSRTRRVVNRLSDALRIAASTLDRSQNALGGASPAA